LLKLAEHFQCFKLACLVIAQNILESRMQATESKNHREMHASVEFFPLICNISRSFGKNDIHNDSHTALQRGNHQKALVSGLIF
jgi:hypothetical protein